MSGIISRCVLAGVDGSAESFAALGLAATEARQRRTRLTVAHAWSGPAWRPGRPAARPTLRADAERLLATATAWLRAHHPHVPVTGRLVLGDPVEVLAAESVGAQVVVVGRHGAGTAAPGWGSVAARLSRDGRVPLIVSGGRGVDPPAGDAPVIVAVPAADRTLRFAFDEAARYGAPLVPCHVGAAFGPAADAALARWSARYPTVRVRPRALRGPGVAAALAVAARDARLLVIGAEPDGPEPTLVDASRGSMPCPVAVVPERPAASGQASAAAPAAEPVPVGR
jgi:nucleotide-binding universal stress UspA family protein